MRFDVITAFPKMFSAPFEEGLVGQAISKGLLNLITWNPRDLAENAHKTIDDRPFGGSDGMVMLPEILKKTLTKVQDDIPKNQRSRVIYLSPQGQKLTQKKAKELAQNYDQITLVSGRYAGLDERFIEKYVHEELSIGDYILTGGELPAMVLIDTVSRFIPGVLGNECSPVEESFKDGLLEEPLYTRPRDFEGASVPEVLTSGHHEKIKNWRLEQRISRTLKKRPDLFSGALAENPNIVSQVQSFLQSGAFDLPAKIAVGLVHYPVYNKAGNVVATNVTNLDIHDIARACRTYGVEKFYIITPLEEQLAFVGRVLEHWQEGRGLQYNPVRSDSLVNVFAKPSIESALEDWGVEKSKVVATSARAVAGPEPIDSMNLRALAVKNPLFLLFGTGWGLENAVVRDADYLLEPIRGRSKDGFRHLSVRSAVSIILDRLFGPCY